MNEYTFKCPIKGDQEVSIGHCQKVHSLGMTSRQPEIEDQVCALAHTCWMCPFRNAVRVGGPWSHYDTKPHAAERPAKPATLPANLRAYALSHRPPSQMDYRRCGMWGEEVGKHDDLFRSFNRSNSPQVTERPGRGKRADKSTRSRTSSRKTAADLVGKGSQSMSEAVSDLAKKESAAKSASPKPESKVARPEDKSAHTERKVAQRAAQRPSETKPKPMSLAERARQMKARRSA